MTENLSILNTMLHTWSDEEVTEAWQMIADEGKRRRSAKTRKLKGDLSVGDNVQWVSRRNGINLGVVEKVKTKNALVSVNGASWNVPISMLTKV